jgi:hypothetical protein
MYPLLPPDGAYLLGLFEVLSGSALGSVLSNGVQFLLSGGGVANFLEIMEFLRMSEFLLV